MVEEVDGWTQVTRRRLPPQACDERGENLQRTLRLRKSKPRAPRKPIREDCCSPRPAIYDQATLRKRFNDKRQIWQESTTRARLKDLLRQQGLSGAVVNRAVSVGLGSPSSEYGNAAVWQLCCFVDLSLMLSEGSLARDGKQEVSTNSATSLVEENGEVKGDQKCQLYAQDPVFNDADQAFLQELGIQVVEEPAAWELLGPESVLFAVHFPAGNGPPGLFEQSYNYKQGDKDEKSDMRGESYEELPSGRCRRIFDDAFPAAIICNDADSNSGWQRCESHRGYDNVRFPYPAHVNSGQRRRSQESQCLDELWRAFNGTGVRVRKDIQLSKEPDKASDALS